MIHVHVCVMWLSLCDVILFPLLPPAPDGFDAVSVQNVGSTYIIVSWDLPTHSNGILINFSLYCNGALAGVLPQAGIHGSTSGWFVACNKLIVRLCGLVDLSWLVYATSWFVDSNKSKVARKLESLPNFKQQVAATSKRCTAYRTVISCY